MMKKETRMTIDDKEKKNWDTKTAEVFFSATLFIVFT